MGEQDERPKVIIPLVDKYDSIELTAMLMWDDAPHVILKIGEEEYRVVGRQMQEAIEYLLSTINTL